MPRTSNMEAPIMLLSGHSGEVAFLKNLVSLSFSHRSFVPQTYICASANPFKQVYTGKFHPSGDILASSGFDRQIFLWKVYGEH